MNKNHVEPYIYPQIKEKHEDLEFILESHHIKIRAEIDKNRQECEARLLNVLPESDIEKFREIIGKMIREM